MSVFSSRFKEALSAKGLKQADIVARTGIGKSSISTYLSGEYEPKQRNIYKIAKALNVSEAWLMGYSDTMERHVSKDNTKEFVPARKRGVKVPILGTVVAGAPVAAVQDIIGYEEITEDLARRGEFYGLKIKGDSMAPQLVDGDIIIFKAQNDCENGQIAIVSIDGDDATCKKVMKSEHGITLIAYNQSVYEPTFYSNEDIEKLPVSIVGVVVESRRSFL